MSLADGHVILARRVPRRVAGIALALVLAVGVAEARGRGPHDEADNVWAPPGVPVVSDEVRVLWRAYDDVAFERTTAVLNTTPTCQQVTLRVAPAADATAFAGAHFVSLDGAPLDDIPFLADPAAPRPCGSAWRHNVGPPTLEEHLELRLPSGVRATVLRRTFHRGGTEAGPDLPERDPRHAALRKTYRLAPEGPTGQTLLLPQGRGRTDGEPLRVRVETPPGWRVEVVADVAGETVDVPRGPDDGWHRPPASSDGLHARVRPETEDAPSGGPVVELALGQVDVDRVRGRLGWEFLTGRQTVLSLSSEHGLDGRHGLGAEFALAPRRGGDFLDLSPNRLTLGLGLLAHVLPALTAGARARAGFGYGPLEIGLRADVLAAGAELAPYFQVTL